MNFEQLRLLLEGAIGKEAAIAEIVKLLGPYRKAAAEEIRSIIQNLPDISLTRKKEFELMLPQMLGALENYGELTYRQILQTTPQIGSASRSEAEAMLKAAGIKSSDLAATVDLDYRDYMKDVRINERTLPGLLTSATAAASPFAISNMARISRFVRTEMFKEVPTEEIATKVVTQVIKQLRGQTDILAATTVYDFDRIIRENIEDANAEQIIFAGLQYEWTTLLDSKTCPVCAPRDGEVHDTREEFKSPTPLVHPKCRCRLVIIDPQDERNIRKGHIISENELTGDNAYKSKRKTKGNKYWEKTEDFRGDYADWLAKEAKQAKTSNKFDMRKVDGKRNIDMHTLTVREALGSSSRAAQYIKAIQGGEAPYIALMRALRSR